MIDLILDNRRIVIYGAGQVAGLLITYLKHTIDDFEKKIVGACVSENKIAATKIHGVTVREISYYENIEEEFLYLIAVKKRFVKQIIFELDKRNIKHYLVFDATEHFDEFEEMLKENSFERYSLFHKNVNRKILTEDEYLTFLSKQLKNDELNFEINLVDHCNLNCQSCNHFSPIAKEWFLDVNQLENDLKQLQKLYGYDINRVMLLGGEPLLHPKLDEVLRVSRECMPHTSIEIVSNGLLLPKMNGKFWNLLHQLNISLVVTVYPVKFDYSYCKELTTQYGVKSNFGQASLNHDETVKTTYVMPIKDKPTFNPYLMYAKCAHANFCVVLREGRIYNCSFAANVHYYNQYFNKHIPDGAEVSLDIYTSTRKQIDDFLKKPNKMCSHCDICGYIYDIPWAVSKKKVEEWNGEKL